jgi:hypothetical protein
VTKVLTDVLSMHDELAARSERGIDLHTKFGQSFGFPPMEYVGGKHSVNILGQLVNKKISLENLKAVAVWRCQKKLTCQCCNVRAIED